MELEVASSERTGRRNKIRNSDEYLTRLKRARSLHIQRQHLIIIGTGGCVESHRATEISSCKIVDTSASWKGNDEVISQTDDGKSGDVEFYGVLGVYNHCLVVDLGDEELRGRDGLGDEACYVGVAGVD